MRLAINLAKNKKNLTGTNPSVGCVIVKDKKIISYGATSLNGRPHAETIALKKCKNKSSESTIYVTLEPCAMCAQAISFSRIRRVYFGAYDYKGGGVENGARIFNQPTCHHVPEVIGGIEEEKCANLLKDFFALRRK